MEGSTKEQIDEKHVIRPQYKHSFNVRDVSAIMRSVLNNQLEGKVYEKDKTTEWTKELAKTIRNELKELKLPRYKFLVQVVIGENAGEGVRMGCRCLWDASTDKVAKETFFNDSLFCVAVAFGVYLY